MATVDNLSQSDTSTHARSVRFALDKTIYVESEIQNGDFDVTAAFYTREEFESIRDEISVFIGERQLTRDKDTNGFCLRGLEFRIPELARKRTASRRRAKVAVLQEQSRQHEVQDFDPEMLAEIYTGFSLASFSQARRIAQADAAAARSIHSFYHSVKKDCNKADDDTASTLSMESFSTAGTL